MLSRLFRYGSIRHHGGVVNLAGGVCSEIPVDPGVCPEIRGLQGTEDSFVLVRS